MYLPSSQNCSNKTSHLQYNIHENDYFFEIEIVLLIKLCVNNSAAFSVGECGKDGYHSDI
jgi:hypothetical protein